MLKFQESLNSLLKKDYILIDQILLNLTMQVNTRFFRL